MRHAARLAVLVAVLDVSNSDSVPPSPPGCAALAQGWQPLCSRGRTYANWHALYCAEPDLALAPSGWLFGECERRTLRTCYEALNHLVRLDCVCCDNLIKRGRRRELKAEAI